MRGLGLVCVFFTGAGITGCDDDKETATGLAEDGQGPGGSSGLGEDDDEHEEREDCSRLTAEECDVSHACTMVWGDAYVPWMGGWCAPDDQEFLACVPADATCDVLEAGCSDDYPGVVYRTRTCVPGFEACEAPGPVTFGCEPS